MSFLEEFSSCSEPLLDESTGAKAWPCGLKSCIWAEIAESSLSHTPNALSLSVSDSLINLVLHLPIALTPGQSKASLCVLTEKVGIEVAAKC